MQEPIFVVDDIFTKGREVAVTGKVARDSIALGATFILSGASGEHEVSVTMIENTKSSDYTVATPEMGELALTLGGVTRADVKKGDKLL